MITLSRNYRFEAAHRLPLVPFGHRCAQLHGHSYKVEVALCGPIDEARGWLVDFYDMDRCVEPLIAALDHRTLNEIEGLENPTCERLCAWLWARLQPTLPGLCEITVWETVDSRCTFAPSA